MEDIALSPCPFCGGTNLLLQVEEKWCVVLGSMGRGRTICGSCSSRGPEVTWMKPMLYQEFRNLIAKKWNTRT